MKLDDVMFPIWVAMAIVTLLVGAGLLTQGAWVLGFTTLLLTIASAVQAWRLR